MKKVYIDEELVEAYKHLINVKEAIDINTLYMWFDDNEIDYSKLNELDMYIYYIKANSEQTLIPQKYVGSTYNGEKIECIKTDCEGNLRVVTNKEQKIFECYCSVPNEMNADYLLCEIQHERGINVSKY